ncbi:MAG: FmdB family zinc ribbon protein [Longimicrobiales bacterium]|jgi:putative FmdB family regulatory protein
MPTYDYQCQKGHRFEVFQRMSDEPVAECPECGEAARRMISGGAGFLFKGDGFYITDYRSDEYKKKASAEKPGSDSSSSSGSSSSNSSSSTSSTSSDSSSSGSGSSSSSDS